eukprot:9078882-Ditylum_brightwellii.AAC.1
MYSLIGAYGEAVPPQAHEDGPFMDEVFQSVSVNLDKNTPDQKYFIHQAGIYLRDGNFTKDNPFFSPTIAAHCSSDLQQCSFGSWGQHAHVPTPYQSNLFYFNRYANCGNGVIEMTSVVHNFGNPNEPESSDYVNYFNLPWGGVRTSTLQSLLLSHANGTTYQVYPIQHWGADGEHIPLLKETAGYSMFAQHLKMPEEFTLRLPCKDPATGNVVQNCDESHFSQGYVSPEFTVRQNDPGRINSGRSDSS